MADSLLQDLTAITVPATTDLLYLVVDPAGTPLDRKITLASLNAFLDHGTFAGLTDDDHTGYALLAGRAGGQVLYGGNAANDDLTLEGTSHATKTTSYVLLQPNGGDVGVGITPTAPFQIGGSS